MQANDIQCGHATDEGRRSVWLSMLMFAGLAAHARPLWAQAEPSASQGVGPRQQAARDDDRIEILREELRKSEAQLEGLMRRKAERLAASDLKAAAEAEEQRDRTLGDIAAIRREIASVSHAATQAAAVRPMAVQAARHPSAAGKRAVPAPWWDVYGSGRRIESPASLSLASPSVQAPAGSAPGPTE
ncbi:MULTISPECIES: hypothetical protein [Variovorax]|uniref:hypothetical protein n=1 Tax=Variovorax TaxID=34072 RepID=UPI0034E8A51E